MDSTFVMSNMIAQSPNVNRGVWEKLESYCRDQVKERDVDLYIIAGPYGTGGTGSEGPRTVLRGAKGYITVPNKCWKVVLAVPVGTTDPRKVTAEARVFAVIMPNTQELERRDWRSYAVPVKDVEALTGYSFFSALPRTVAAASGMAAPALRSMVFAVRAPRSGAEQERAVPGTAASADRGRSKRRNRHTRR
jgi:endonuclease G